MDIKKIEELVKVVTQFIPTVGAIVATVIGVINSLENVTQEDKDALIVRIKKAQESVPAWE